MDLGVNLLVIIYDVLDFVRKLKLILKNNTLSSIIYKALQVFDYYLIKDDWLFPLQFLIGVDFNT